MATYHEFPQREIDQLIETGRANFDEQNIAARSSKDAVLGASPLIVGEVCISVTVEDGKVCLKIPIVDIEECFKVPGWIPDGTVVKACLKICFIGPVPSGVCVLVTALDKEVFRRCYGAC
ncbi:hypothetical protein I5192_10775 [Ruegeria sp. SCSIO 43209]|uniref:hypothetical protein n=1 Tax=Ruegeria sp. SCSIO 43209 TaxID=2793010 RepID=UPI00147CDF04|nr:hypothetical protein [Ruegeria sp. SCSIO 43209]UAB87723.1 hypothetical protein I5192_10775 [Ruegeria sp. SCSIO 43209]